MTCFHEMIVMANTNGKPCGMGYEVDFVIRCHICEEELFRISEYKREIHNLSKH